MPLYLPPMSGSWTPAFTCATPGDLNIAYSSQSGTYFRIGIHVIARFGLTTSTFTHGTASGTVSITGLPFAVGIAYGSSLSWQGITTASYTDMTMFPLASTTTARIMASGTATNRINLPMSVFPSGGTVSFIGMIEYDI